MIVFRRVSSEKTVSLVNFDWPWDSTERLAFHRRSNLPPSSLGFGVDVGHREGWIEFNWMCI